MLELYINTHTIKLLLPGHCFHHLKLPMALLFLDGHRRRYVSSTEIIFHQVVNVSCVGKAIYSY